MGGEGVRLMAMQREREGWKEADGNAHRERERERERQRERERGGGGGEKGVEGWFSSSNRPSAQFFSSRNVSGGAGSQKPSDTHLLLPASV